jgi:hypothetical protein
MTAEPPQTAKALESAAKTSSGEPETAPPTPSKGKSAPTKTGDGTIDMLGDRFATEIVEVKEAKETTPKKK